MLKKQIVIISRSHKINGLTKQIFGYVCKTLGRGKTKKEYLDWLKRLGQYWAYHDKNPSDLIYGRPETLIKEHNIGNGNVKKRVRKT